jgi:hypothetical protein
MNKIQILFFGYLLKSVLYVYGGYAEQRKEPEQLTSTNFGPKPKSFEIFIFYPKYIQIVPTRFK